MALLEINNMPKVLKKLPGTVISFFICIFFIESYFTDKKSKANNLPKVIFQVNNRIRIQFLAILLQFLPLDNADEN